MDDKVFVEAHVREIWKLWIQGHSPNHLGNSIVIRGASSKPRSLSSASVTGITAKPNRNNPDSQPNSWELMSLLLVGIVMSPPV